MIKNISSNIIHYINKEDNKSYNIEAYMEFDQLYELLDKGEYLMDDIVLDLKNCLFNGNKITNIDELIQNLRDDYKKMASKIKVNPVA